MLQRNKDDPLTSPPLLYIVSFHERKPRLKKTFVIILKKLPSARLKVLQLSPVPHSVCMEVLLSLIYLRLLWVSYKLKAVVVDIITTAGLMR